MEIEHGNLPKCKIHSQYFFFVQLSQYLNKITNVTSVLCSSWSLICVCFFFFKYCRCNILLISNKTYECNAFLYILIVDFMSMYIYIYAFNRRFYPKRLTLHLSYSFYILSALAFPGNRTHDLGIASAMHYQLSYRKAMYILFKMIK